MSDVIVNEITAFRARLDPMLMRLKSAVTTSETRTEFRGIFQPGVTCALIRESLKLVLVAVV